jgi:hypothetical protein
MLARDFEDVFRRHDPNQVPQGEELDDIWAYMVVHLNYLRVTTEERPVKLEQYLRNLEYVSDVVAPGDALALHFRQVLLQRMQRDANPKLAERLHELLRSQPYWRERFDQFGITAACAA